MTGKARYNFHTFYACEEWLESEGIPAHNPARVDEEQFGFNPDFTVEEQGFDLTAAMRRDLAFILSDDCDGVVVLPGWEQSVGARWEVGVAQTVGKPVQEWVKQPIAGYRLEPVGKSVWAVL